MEMFSMETNLSEGPHIEGISYHESALDADYAMPLAEDPNNEAELLPCVQTSKQLEAWPSADGSAEVMDDLPISMDEAEEEVEAELEEDLPPLSEELQEGYKILQYIKQGLIPQKKADPGQVHQTKTYRYVYGISEQDPMFEKYSEIVEQPMCLQQMEQKFREAVYTTAAEFVSDFERMVWNWDCFCALTESKQITPRADDLYKKVQSQLTLLSQTMRQKIYADLDMITVPWRERSAAQQMYASSRSRSARRDILEEMQMMVRRRKEQYQKEQKRLKREKDQKNQQAEFQRRLDWEATVLTAGPMKSIIKHSWELPQMGLFLFLCDETLRLPIPEVAMYEFERCFAMPRQSRLLKTVMSCLLRVEELEGLPLQEWMLEEEEQKAEPAKNKTNNKKKKDNKRDDAEDGDLSQTDKIQTDRNQERKLAKKKLESRLAVEKKHGPMSFKKWSRKLTRKVDVWYRKLTKFHGDVHKAALSLGIDEKCFEILGMTNPLHDRPFHRLSPYKAIWIVKSLMDYLVERLPVINYDMALCEMNDEEIKERIAKGKVVKDAGDAQAQVLGTDRHGNVYIHFRQFCGPDLRVYVQKAPKKSCAKRKLNMEKIEDEVESVCSTSVNDDSDKESTVSTAPSETRTKSIAGSSRQSSPMPRGTNRQSRQSSPSPRSRRSRNSSPLSRNSKRSRQSSPVSRSSSRPSRQTSARSSPVPETSLSDILQPARGRRTRNSAEPAFTTLIDPDVLFRKSSRGVKGGKKTAKQQEEKNADKEVGENDSNEQGSKNEDDDEVGGGGSKGGKRNDDVDVTPKDTGSKEKGDSVNGSRKDNGQSESESGSTNICREEGDADDKSACADLSQGRAEDDGQNTPLLGAAAAAHSNSQTNPSSKSCDSDASAMQNGSSSSKNLSVKAKCDNVKSEPVEDDECPFLTPVTSGSKVKPSTLACDRSVPRSNLPKQSTPLSSSTISLTDSVKKENDSGYTSFFTDGITPVKSLSPDEEDKKPFPKADSDTKVKAKLESISEEKDCDGDNKDDAKLDDDDDKVDVKSEETDVKSEGGDSMSVSESASSNNLAGLATSSRPPTGVSSALLDHLDYSEEELVPDPLDFELVVDTVEALDDLVKRFEPVDPQPFPSPSTSTRLCNRQQKSPAKPTRRPNCEIELHGRLKNLQTELSAHRQNFVKTGMNILEKMRQEYETHVEGASEAEDSDSEIEEKSATDAEQEAMEAEEDENSASQPALAPPRKRPPARAAVTAEKEEESSEEEEYELDVSSRGRIRTRRVIPNNAEDPHAKRKKLVKKGGEDIAAETPPTTTSPTFSSSSTSSSTHIITQEQLASVLRQIEQQGGLHAGGGTPTIRIITPGQSGPGHVIRPAALSSLLVQSANTATQRVNGQGARIIQHTPQGVVVRSLSSHSASHPVMQHILSRPPDQQQSRNVQATAQVFQSRVQTPVTVTVMTTSPTGTVTMTRAAGVVGGGKPLYLTVQGNKQMSHDEFLQLIRQQAGQTGTTVTQPSGSALTTVTPACASPMVQQTQPHEIFCRTPDGQECVLLNAKGGMVCLPKSALSKSPLTEELASGLPRTLVVCSTGHSTAVVCSGQQPLGTPTGPRNAGSILSRGAANRYASNATVKELLKAKSEESEGLGAVVGKDANLGSTLLTVTQASPPVTSSATSPLAVITSGNASVAATQRVMVLPNSSCSLDEALKAVVTDVHTSLPTANIKVPAPTTLPCLSPRKPHTRTIPSSIAPIPTVPKFNTPMTAALSVVASSGMVTTGTSGAVIMPVGVPMRGKNQVLVLRPEDSATLLQSLAARGASGGAVRMIQVGSNKGAASSRSSSAAPTLVSAGATAVSPMTGCSVVSSAFNLASASNSAASLQLLSSQPVAAASGVSPILQLSSRPLMPAQSATLSAANILSTACNTQHAIASVPLVQQNAVDSTTPGRAAIPVAIRGVRPNTVVVAQPGLMRAQNPNAIAQLRGRIINGAPTAAQLNISLAGAGMSAGTTCVTASTAYPSQTRPQASLPENLIAGLQPGVNTVRLVAAGPHGGVQQIVALRQGSVLGGLQGRVLLTPGGQPTVVIPANPGQVVGSNSSQTIVIPAGGNASSAQTVVIPGHSGQGMNNAQAITVLHPNASSAPQPVQYCMKLVPSSTNAPTPTVMPLSNIMVGSVPGSGTKVVLANPAASHNVAATLPRSVVSAVVNAHSPASVGLGVPSGPIHSASVNDSAAVVMLNNLAKLKPAGPVVGVTPNLNQGQVTGSLSQGLVMSNLSQGLITSNLTQGLVTPNLLRAGVKRSATGANCLQPIPPKMARVDGLSGGAVLASLGQMAGSDLNLNLNPASQTSGDAKTTSPVRVNVGIPRMVVGASGGSHVGASSTLQCLAAAHLTTTTSPSTSLAYSQDSNSLAPLNPVHIMQQLNLPMRPEQSVVRQTGNLSNGEIKVLPGTVLLQASHVNTPQVLSSTTPRSVQLQPRNILATANTLDPAEILSSMSKTAVLGNAQSTSGLIQNNLAQGNYSPTTANNVELFSPSQAKLQMLAANNKSPAKARFLQQPVSCELSQGANGVGFANGLGQASVANSAGVVNGGGDDGVGGQVVEGGLGDGHDEVDAEAAQFLLTLSSPR